MTEIIRKIDATVHARATEIYSQYRLSLSSSEVRPVSTEGLKKTPYGYREQLGDEELYAYYYRQPNGGWCFELRDYSVKDTLCYRGKSSKLCKSRSEVAKIVSEEYVADSDTNIRQADQSMSNKEELVIANAVEAIKYADDVLGREFPIPEIIINNRLTSTAGQECGMPKRLAHALNGCHEISLP